MLGKLKIHGCSLCLQLFWWSRARNHCKNQEKTRKNTKNLEEPPEPLHKPRKQKKKIQTISQNPGIRGFSWFLQWFWWSRARDHCKNQEKTRKNTKKLEEPPEPLHKPRKQKQKNSNYLSKSRNSWFFVVFTVVLVGGQELETTLKTMKNNQNSILRDSLKIAFCVGFSWFLQWFWWFFAVVGGFFESFTIGLVGSTSKPL